MVSLDTDPEAAIRLGRGAILSRVGPGDRGPELADQFEAAVRGGTRTGALYRRDGRATGIAVWMPHGSAGVELTLWHLSPGDASSPAYSRFWDGIRALAGPVAFVPGRLPGLSSEEEGRLLRGLGLAPYSRREMRLADGASVPDPLVPPGGRLRPVGPDDRTELARLHRDAYHDRFDRYLFLEEEDEGRDAARLVGDLFHGRWGPFEAAGSWGVTLDGRLAGAVLSVRRPEGTLIADVMVDPGVQGRGIGRAVLLAALRSLLAAGAGPVYLNVTDGNDRARRLYDQVGFELSLGPSTEWYDPARIPGRF